MNKQLLEIFSDIEDYHWWFAGRRMLIERKIGEYFNNPKNLRLLDIGCGTGGNYKFLSKYGKVYGIDNSDTAIKYCKQKKIKNVQKANATTLPFPEKHFDIVLALDVFEHIKNDGLALKEAKRVLKDNGAIILTVPALPFIWSKHDELQNHFRRYKKDRLANIGDMASLQTKEISYFNTFLSPPIILVRSFSKLSPLKNFGKYDSKINFEIAKNKKINRLLTSIFKSELSMREKIIYPIGISLLAIYKK